MPIAVSVVVGPSRIHRCLLAGAGFILLAAACAVGLGTSARFHAGPLQALVLAIAGGALVHAGWRRAKTHRLDISGTGEMVLTVQRGLRTRAAVVNLLPGSVVWPPLMLLRLRPEGAGTGVVMLPVWRDSIAPEAWRTLAVAVAVIARKI